MSAIAAQTPIQAVTQVSTQVATSTPVLSGPITATIIEEVFTVLAASAHDQGVDLETARNNAQTALEKGLAAFAYPKLKHVPNLITAHWTKLQRSGKPLIAPDAPATVTREIAAFIDPSITFAARKASAPAQAVSVEVQEAVAQASNQNAPAWLKMSFDPGQTSSIDYLINQATNATVPTLQAMLELARGAFEAVEARKYLKSRLEEQKALCEAGDLEAAAAITVEMEKAHPAAPFTPAQIVAPLKRPINMELSTLTNGALDDFDLLIDMVLQAEPTTKAMDGELSEMRRANRQLLPKTAVSTDSVDGLACEIIMRRASDLFANAYDGSDTMLDFDVPTIVFDESHPDVPAYDPTYHFFAPHLADVLHSINRNKVTALVGEAGSGKSEFVLQIGAVLGMPVFRLNMDSHQTRADLIGQHKIVQSDTGSPVTLFVEGMLPRALSQPSILLVDEWDAGDPEIMPILQPILEGRGVMILEDGARYVKPHAFSRIVLTGNTNGRGSSNAAYNNIHEQSAATIDRIEKILKMPYLPADLERKVVEARVSGVDTNFVAKLIQLANKIREAYDASETQQLCSTRTVMAAAERHRDFQSMYDTEAELIGTTLEVCLLNFCSETDRTTVKGLIDAIF